MSKEIRYKVCWEHYDYFSECESVRSVILKSEEMAKQFAKDNELGCWWIEKIEVEG